MLLPLTTVEIVIAPFFCCTGTRIILIESANIINQQAADIIAASQR
jgi:hypothetical protein